MTDQHRTSLQSSLPIYLPLAGGCRRIELICNATAQQDGLVRAYFIGAPGHGPEMIDSAERAAHAVYGILRQHGIQLPDKCMAGFHLLRQEGKTPATLCGESGGLAFAIAFASGLLGPPPCPVAATGRIDVCTADAAVESVMAVEEKIRATAPLLGEGSLFFLPQASRDALSPELAREMQQQGVEIIFVTTLAEALARLWPETLKQKNKDGRSPLPQAMSEQSILSPLIARRSGLLPMLLVCCVFACAGSAPAGQRGKARQYHDNTIGMDFVYVEGGIFTMGCGPWSGKCEDNAVPPHRVKLSPFYMAVTEVSNRQWKTVMGSSTPRDDTRPDFPREDLSWFSAAAFTNTLSRAEGLQPCYQLADCTGTPGEEYTCKQVTIQKSCTGFRLPTEAQWEYACRSSGKEEKYCGGSRAAEVAWGGDNIFDTGPVGSKKPNGLGLYDMSGNVWEWCQDWYGPYPDSATISVDPQGPVSRENRVLRGGSWMFGDYDRTSTTRESMTPEYWNYHFGIRLVLPIAHR